MRPHTSCSVLFFRCPAGDEVCGEILSRGGPAPTDWSRLLEPLPFFELFKHFLQVGFACSRCCVCGKACCGAGPLGNAMLHTAREA